MAHSRNPSRHARSESAHALAQGLGVFSLALGALELFAAKPLARWLGMEKHETLLRAYGAREIATGIGILTAKDPTPWIYARVGGDALDIATLGAGLADDSTEQDRVGLALGAVAGVTVLDVLCAKALTDETQQHRMLSARPSRDYSRRSGYPQGANRAHGAARDFEVPRDFRIPEPLRPYNTSATVPTPVRQV
ncbi:hypothetical protein [Microvirga pudoricolor]|uniref:hypothetical protein n=1 Tax=Microvirga pudoricolor TaxID=2778729 RepID=UPI001951FD3E|nr:hypothetical protein [Microvirga pudoricolor]MBM6596731.1 hypothetical protein [Microvirga pudoricolor]